MNRIHIAPRVLPCFLALTWFFPANAMAQEEGCTNPDCIGCETEQILGTWYHRTSDSQVLWGCVDEEQLPEHANNQGCTDEPHENPCEGLCLQSHDACGAGEQDEELAVVLDAIQEDDIGQAVALLAGLGADCIWNEHRGAWQAISRCQNRVLLHVPAPPHRSPRSSGAHSPHG